MLEPPHVHLCRLRFLSLFVRLSQQLLASWRKTSYLSWAEVQPDHQAAAEGVYLLPPVHPKLLCLFWLEYPLVFQTATMQGLFLTTSCWSLDSFGSAVALGNDGVNVMRMNEKRNGYACLAFEGYAACLQNNWSGR